MGCKKNSIRTLACVALIIGTVLVAGCGQHATTNTSAPQGQTLQTASAPVQPYTVVDQLPAKPAVVQDHRRSLHLTYHDNRYCLADDSGDYYDCGRDSHGNLYPVYFDRETNEYCPLYYDADRDRYYCAVHENGRFYRRYWDDPQDLYYDDQYDYYSYNPPDQDRPVIFVQNNYYNEYNNGSFNRPHHGHNNNALLAAIPVVSVAFVALERSGHHEHPATVASRVPPRPVATYRAAPPNSRSFPGAPRQTAVAQRPSPPNGHGPIGFTRPPKPMPAMPPTRRVASGPPAQPLQSGPHMQQHPSFAHKQPTQNIASKPVAKPMVRAAKPAPQRPGTPQVARLPVGVHTHPMIPAKPAPKSAPRMAIRPPASVVRHVAQKPSVMTQHRPQPAPRSRVAVQALPHPAQKVVVRQAAPARPRMTTPPAHPAPKTAARQAPPARPQAAPPAYHRTPAPAQKPASAPAQKPASAPANKWKAAVKNAKPASEGSSGGRDQKKDQQH